MKLKGFIKVANKKQPVVVYATDNHGPREVALAMNVDILAEVLPQYLNNKVIYVGKSPMYEDEYKDIIQVTVRE